MVRLPRDLSSRKLISALARLGYVKIKQEGSHIRLETRESGRHRVVVPEAKAIPVGTLHTILRDVALHFDKSVKALIDDLDL